MTYKIKRRWAKSLLFLSLLFVFGFSTFAQIISPSLGTPKASAASPEFTLYYPNDRDSKDQLVKAAQDGGIGDDDANGILSKTKILTKGWPFGAAELEFSPSFSNKNDIPTYTVDYYCTPKNGKQTLTQPDSSQYYLRISLGVTILDNNNWSGIVDDKTYDTYVGMLGNKYVGTFHSPLQTVNGQTIPSSDTNLTGKGGDHDIRTSVGNQFVSTNGITASAINDCFPSPTGHVANKATNYNKLSSAQQKAWDKVMQKAGLGGATDTDSSSGSGDEPTLECDTKFLNPLTWITCPLIDGLSTVVSELDSLITSQLSVGSPGNSEDPNQIFCSGNTSGGDQPECMAYHQAWSVFRNLALGILVIVGLLMILSEMAGMEVFDAYTVRKTLPRLVVAAIGITLSWQLMQFLVELTNAIGYGIRFLIYQPFVNNSELNTAVLGGGGAAAANLLLIGGFFLLGPIGMLSFVGTAAIGVIVAFLTLVVREIIIIAAVLVSPVAIALYILPNTERFFRMWWDTFFKALMMFPLIAAMIASGRVFAAIASQGNTVGQILGFAAYFAPYFLLPMTFKYAGAAIAGIGGFFNNNGITNWGRQTLGGYRSKKAAENWQNTKDFSRFSDRNAMTRGLNNLGGAVTNRAFRPKKYRSTKEAGKFAYGARTMKDNIHAQTHQNDDSVLIAMADQDLARQKFEEAKANHEKATRAHSAAVAAGGGAPTAIQQQAIDAAEAERVQYGAEMDARQHGLDVVSAMGAEAKSVGFQRQALSALAKTGFQFKQGEAGYDELRGVADRLAGGDDGAFRSIMNDAQYGLRTAGRYELGGINNGAGYDPSLGLSKASLYEIANAKGETLTAMIDMAGTAPSHEAAVLYKELKAMQPNAKGGNAKKINDAIKALETNNIHGFMDLPDPSGRTRTVMVGRDPATGAPVYGQRPVTRGDMAEEQARSYERPDPNNIP